MNAKPNDFFIGVVDFFAVLLPGALLTYFMQGHWYNHFFGAAKVFPALETEVEKGFVFLIVAYILGNIAYLIASIMDPLVYDRFLRNVFFKKNADLAYLVATNIKEKYLHSEDLIQDLQMRNKLTAKETKEQELKTKEVINTYKFVQHYMLLKKPEALIELKKLEADSKFFRCLVISFLFIAVFAFVH
ncbi:MAG TPA: hypothetical protein VFM90_05565, partial [Cyclobacteriaceae bacterium]|nr:hypothetical protein [Cyclobacteriaceae bacterium]